MVNKASTVIDTVFVEGQKLTDEKQISKAFTNQNIAETKKRFSFKYIQPPHVFRVLSKLENGKAVGIHNIPNKSLKPSKDIISNSLADTFYASVINNIFPVDLKIGIVIPLLKAILEKT